MFAIVCYSHSPNGPVLTRTLLAFLPGSSVRPNLAGTTRCLYFRLIQHMGAASTSRPFPSSFHSPIHGCTGCRIAGPLTSPPGVLCLTPAPRCTLHGCCGHDFPPGWRRHTCTCKRIRVLHHIVDTVQPNPLHRITGWVAFFHIIFLIVNHN